MPELFWTGKHKLEFSQLLPESAKYSIHISKSETALARSNNTISLCPCVLCMSECDSQVSFIINLALFSDAFYIGT